MKQLRWIGLPTVLLNNKYQYVRDQVFSKILSNQYFMSELLLRHLGNFNCDEFEMGLCC